MYCTEYSTVFKSSRRADKTLSDFLSDMRKSFMSGITENLHTELIKEKQ